MKSYSQIEQDLKSNPRRWLVTGAAGFIGSNLCHRLLELNQHVIGFDNFFSGEQKNVDELNFKFEKTKRWNFLKKDICNFNDILEATQGIQFVLHQAAVGSVPRSIKEPLVSHASNVDGFIKTIEAAKQSGVEKFVYASSSSVYGDHPALPKVEENLGEPLSPYAVTKKIDEMYAKVFARCYEMPAVGLRYFNVFGPGQNPKGPYAAVIPLWIESLIQGEPVYINGDGSYSRDFCYIENVLQANILAATSAKHTNGRVYNIAFGGRTDLKQLYKYIQEALSSQISNYAFRDAVYREFRSGDIPHSHADIKSAIKDLGYKPTISAADGIQMAVKYYLEKK